MNINRDFLIVLDVKSGEVDSPNIYYFNTDKNTSNLYVQMVIKETNIEATPIDNATNYSIKANILKPNMVGKIVEGDLVNEEKAIYEFKLPADCTDFSGNAKIEFEVYCTVDGVEKIATSFATKFKVHKSVFSEQNKYIEDSSDYPILKQLIDEVKELQSNGGTGTGTSGHIHNNKTVLDSITSTKVNNWNTAYAHSQSAHFSGDYNDLTNQPTIPTEYTHPITHPASMITGLADVATSGSYNDLTDKPTIPPAYTHPTTHPASIITGLSSVATSGDYNDLTNKPTIPSEYNLPVANQNTLGGIKVGAGLSITADGILSATGGGTSIDIDDTTIATNKTWSSSKISSQIKDIANKINNIGQPTDDQVNTAVNSYFENNPINIDDLWSDLVEGEVYNVKLPATQIGIRAVFDQGSNVIYTDHKLNSLKNILVVSKVYSDNTSVVITDYILSGSLTIGTSTITVISGSYTTTFTVIVSEKPTATLSSISAIFTQESMTVTPSTDLDTLRANLVVTATYSDNSTINVIDYTLSGTLNVGISIITVTFNELTTTFNVTVSDESGYETDGLAVYYDFTQYSDGYTGEIEDLSGNNISPTITGLESYESGRNGIIGGKFMINSHRTSSGNSSISIPVSCINEYPFSIEMYLDFRANYDPYAANGTLTLYGISNRSNYFEIFSTRNGGTTGNGYLFRVIPDTGLFNISGNLDNPSVSFENTGITVADSTMTTITPVHIVVNIGGPNNEYSLYVNGTLIETKNITSAISLSGDRYLSIGTSDLYMVRVYNKILTQANVTKNYNHFMNNYGGGN